MSTTPALDLHAKQVREYLDSAAKLKSQSADYRLKAGHELIAARRRVKAGETTLSWSAWCAQNIKRSARDIRRLMALAGADDPTQARENEKARNREAKPAGSRAASAVQGRTGASPAAASASFVNGAKNSVADLRFLIDIYWPLLSLTDQRSIVDLLIERMAAPRKPAVVGAPGKQAQPATSGISASRDRVQPTDSKKQKPRLRTGPVWAPPSPGYAPPWPWQR